MVKNSEALEEHMIEGHEQIVILHTMASQVNDMHAKQEKNENFQTDLLNALKNLSDRISALENKTLEKEDKIEEIYSKKDDKDRKRKNAINVLNKEKKHKITWVGTSLSKVLDKKKVEKDQGVELNAVKAYYVKEEGRIENESFEAIVPDVIKAGHIDTLVLEAGNTEITNFEVNKAMMNTDIDIDETKEGWFKKAEETSKSIFQIAEKSIANDPNLNVVIVKRPERFDKSSKDILGIKAKVSDYANQVYDQLKLKSNNSQRIHLVDLNLGAKKSNHLKELIYGGQDDPSYDGIHLSGGGASRHFTYRAVQALKHIVPCSRQEKMSSSPSYNKSSARGGSTGRYAKFDHNNCPQAQYQRGQLLKQRCNKTNQSQHYDSYASAVKNNSQTRGGQTYSFSIPTKNRFDLLTRNSQGNW